MSALAPAPEVAVASSGAAGLVGGQAFDAAVFTGKRCKRGQQQACWSSGSAVPEHDLEQSTLTSISCHGPSCANRTLTTQPGARRPRDRGGRALPKSRRDSPRPAKNQAPKSMWLRAITNARDGARDDAQTGLWRAQKTTTPAAGRAPRNETDVPRHLRPMSRDSTSAERGGFEPPMD